MAARMRRGPWFGGPLCAFALGVGGCAPAPSGADGGPDVGPVPPGHVAFVFTFRAGPYCREYVHRPFERIYVQYVEAAWRTPTGEFSRGPWPDWVGLWQESPPRVRWTLFPQASAACDCDDCPEPLCAEMWNDYADTVPIAFSVENGESVVALWDGRLITPGAACGLGGCIGRASAAPGRYTAVFLAGWSYHTPFNGRGQEVDAVGPWLVEFYYPEDRVVEYVHDCTRPLPLPEAVDGGT